MNKRQNIRTALYLYDIGYLELLHRHKIECFLIGDKAAWALCWAMLTRWDELKGK